MLLGSSYYYSVRVTIMSREKGLNL